MRHREISKFDKIIDSRDVIARLKELRDLADTAKETAKESRERIAELEAMEEHTIEQADELDRLSDSIWEHNGTEYAEGDFTEDEADELAILEKLNDEASGYGDWDHGETLIHRSHFVEYAHQLAEDIGAISGDETWPATCIDWEKAAEELEADYMTIDFDGEEFLMRCPNRNSCPCPAHEWGRGRGNGQTCW